MVAVIWVLFENKKKIEITEWEQEKEREHLMFFFSYFLCP